MAGSMSRQDEANSVFGLRLSQSTSCPLRTPHVGSTRKKFLFGHVINLLLAKLVFHGQDGWILAFSCIVDIGLDFILILKNLKKTLAIWTSSLVNRAFVSLNLNFYVGVDRTVLNVRSKWTSYSASELIKRLSIWFKNACHDQRFFCGGLNKKTWWWLICHHRRCLMTLLLLSFWDVTSLWIRWKFLSGCDNTKGRNYTCYISIQISRCLQFWMEVFKLLWLVSSLYSEKLFDDENQLFLISRSKEGIEIISFFLCL